MSWPQETLDTIRRLNRIEHLLKQLFSGRDTAIELMVLGVVCQEHVLLLGPPGTAKTDLIHHFADLIDARVFQYLLTRFSEPAELFGPLDIPAFQAGQYRIRTGEMLPEAQLAFLDEVFQSNSAILNALLALIHERVFHNGPTRQPVPLISLIGASNTLPDDPGLRAFADRFVLRLQVESVSDDLMDELLRRGWDLEIERMSAASSGGSVRPEPVVSMDRLIALNRRLLEVHIEEVRPLYLQLLREMRAEGIEISDRRAVKGLKLIAGAALLRQAEVAGAEDLWPLNHIWTLPDEARVLQQLVQPRVLEAGGRALEVSRPEYEIEGDLGVLEGQLAGLRSEAAWGAHLQALGRLRREVLKHYRENKTLLRRIEQVIHQALHREEVRHV